MLRIENPFTWHIIQYVCFSLAMLVIFWIWGFLSPWLNRKVCLKTEGQVKEIFGQVFWRYFKCVSIAIGTLSLLGSFVGIERLLNENFKPDIQKYISHDMNNYRAAVSDLLNTRCAVTPSERNFCVSVSAAIEYIEHGTIDQRTGVKFVQNKIAKLPQNEQVKYINMLANRLEPAFGIISEQQSVAPTVKIGFSVVSVYALALALAISFGEAVFQFKLERDKAADQKSLFQWFRGRRKREARAL